MSKLKKDLDITSQQFKTNGSQFVIKDKSRINNI